MKLEYRVLCIDDKIPTLDETKEKIHEFNLSVGIKTLFHDISVKAEPAENPENFYLRIVSEVEAEFEAHIFDLILVDLHMPGDFDGRDIVSTIRKDHSFYRPILFYSAGEPVGKDEAIEQLNHASSDANILGKSIFIVSREGLRAKATEIFGEMHNEEHKINSVRGLLMDSVSEFDAQIIEIIQDDSLWGLIPEGDAKQKIVTEFRRYIEQDYEEAKLLYEKVKRLDISKIQSLLKESPKDISTYRKGYLLKSILKKIESLKKNGDILSDGIEGEGSLRGMRNEYGHTTAEKLSSAHSDEKCITIRRAATQQLQNIQDIGDSL